MGVPKSWWVFFLGKSQTKMDEGGKPYDSGIQITSGIRSRGFYGGGTVGDMDIGFYWINPAKKVTENDVLHDFGGVDILIKHHLCCTTASNKRN